MKKETAKKANKLADEIAEDHPSHIALYVPELTTTQKSILKFRLRGLKQETIASILEVSQPYISQELAKIRKFHLARGTDINQAIIIGENMSFYEEIESKAWELYEIDKEIDKLKALSVILAARKDGNKLLMDVGVLKKTPTVTEHLLKKTPLVERLMKEGQTDNAVREVIEVTYEELEEPEPPLFEAENEEIIDMEVDELEAPEPPEED